MTAKPITLGKAVQAYLASLTRRSPRTRKAYAESLDPLAARFGPGTPLAALEPAEVAAWFTQHWGEKSAATWNLRLAALRSASAWWAEQDWRPDDIASRLKKEPPRPVRAVELLTGDEVRAMLATIDPEYPSGLRNRALVMVLYRAGLRLDEALSLQVKDLDMEQQTINVRSGKGSKQRIVAMDAGAARLVQQWLDKRRELGLRANGNPLFCVLWESRGERGAPLSASYVQKMLKDAAREAGITKRVHPHGMRHTHFSELAAEGVPVNVISRQAGHASSGMTARYIDHIAPAEVIAMGKAREAFSPEAKPARPGREIDRLERQAQALLDAVEALRKEEKDGED